MARQGLEADLSGTPAAPPVAERSRMVDACSAVEDAMAVGYPGRAEQQSPVEPVGAEAQDARAERQRQTAPRPSSPWRWWQATGTVQARAHRREGQQPPVERARAPCKEHSDIVVARAGARTRAGGAHVRTPVGDDTPVDERARAPRMEHADIVVARAGAHAACQRGCPRHRSAGKLIGLGVAQEAGHSAAGPVEEAAEVVLGCCSRRHGKLATSSGEQFFIACRSPSRFRCALRRYLYVTPPDATAQPCSFTPDSKE